MKPVPLTFTGVDAHTELARLTAIGTRYPHVEFAVLVGSRTCRAGGNRYPGPATVREFRRRATAAHVRCAIHLCGCYSRAVMKQEWTAPFSLQAASFDRIQVNSSRYDMTAVAAFARLAQKPVIVQWRTLHLHMRVPGIQFLYDESGGRGRNGLKSWPLRSRFGGFAGGLGPENIRQAVGYVRMTARKGSWLDMETGVRTNDWFDLDKVEEVIDVAMKET